MKIVKTAILFTFGILAVLLAIGCSQPITSSEGAVLDGNKREIGLDEEFEVDLVIEADGPARSVVGVTTATIKMDGGPRNFVQVFVVDEDAAQIVSFAEAKKLNSSDNTYSLSLPSLTRNKDYSFLLLMGNLETTYTMGDYVYTNKIPTLLAAGFAEGESLSGASTGTQTITIKMTPVVVNTYFTNGLVFRHPKIEADGTLGKAYLDPGTWSVTWNIWQTMSGGNGFLKALVPAYNKLHSSSPVSNTLEAKGRNFILNKNGSNNGSSPVIPGGGLSSSFSDSIGSLVGNDSGFVNFNVTYAPFGLDNTGGIWNSFPFFQKGVETGVDNYPRWIIRNGLNNLSQDDDTNFGLAYPNANNNMNGGVRFAVALDPEPPTPPTTPPYTPSQLVISDAVFTSYPMVAEPELTYTTGGGYVGNATLWYAIVAKDASAPTVASGAYIYTLGNDIEPGSHSGTLSVDISSYSSGYDVYMLLAKEGAVGSPVKLEARPTGDADIEWEFEIEDTFNLLNRLYEQPALNAQMIRSSFNGNEEYSVVSVAPDPDLGTWGLGWQTFTVILEAKPDYAFVGKTATDFTSDITGMSASTNPSETLVQNGGLRMKITYKINRTALLYQAWNSWMDQ